MVSLAMPAEYDSVVAASPPVFSHSPPTPGGGSGGFLANYGHFRFEADHWQHHHFNYNNARNFNSWAPVTRRQENHRRPPPSLPVCIPHTNKASPRRPCLVVRPEEATSPESSPEEPSSPTRLKKKVVFADDRGLSLTQVRVMREPSDCPPLWTLEFLAQVTRGVAAAAAAASSDGSSWETSFSQPAADYLAFRRRLDSSSVSLENAVVVSGTSSENNSAAALVGTVKVRNLAFQKDVSIRHSFDNWATHGDLECSFVPSSSPLAPPALYDTFSFSLKLPSNARRMEFCIRFRCEGSEYWDNNEGSNYVVVRPQAVADSGAASAVAAAASLAAASSLARHAQRKFDDAIHAKMSTWSEFASWNHLVNDSPYW